MNALTNLKLPHFIALAILFHLSLLFVFHKQTSKTIISSTENLVLSFNLTTSEPQASTIEPSQPIEEKITIPVEKKQTKQVIKKEPITQAKQQSITGSSVTATISPIAKSNYENLLASWLSKYKTYPSRAKRRGQTGEALIYVKINQAGKLIDYYLKTSTDHELLDNAIVKMIEQANPLPAIPANFKKNTYEFIAPVSFQLN